MNYELGSKFQASDIEGIEVGSIPSSHTKGSDLSDGDGDDERVRQNESISTDYKAGIAFYLYT